MYMLNSCNCFVYECSSCTVLQPPAWHTGVLDIYRYTLAPRYAGALVYYLARRRASHFEIKNKAVGEPLEEPEGMSP